MDPKRVGTYRGAFGMESVALSQIESDMLQVADDLLDQADQTSEVQRAREIIQGVIDDVEGDN